MIKAETHSDDYAVEIEFDATDWFEQASDDEILALAAIGWGGDYEADAVAEHFEATSCARLFAYLGFSPTMPWSNDSVGFECHVDEQSALAWIASRRPDLAGRID
jgi:hypothetical protein